MTINNRNCSFTAVTYKIHYRSIQTRITAVTYKIHYNSIQIRIRIKCVTRTENKKNFFCTHTEQNIIRGNTNDAS